MSSVYTPNYCQSECMTYYWVGGRGSLVKKAYYLLKYWPELMN